MIDSIQNKKRTDENVKEMTIRTDCQLISEKIKKNHPDDQVKRIKATIVLLIRDD